MAKLTSAEITEYQEQGLVVPQYRLSNSQVNQLREALDQLIAQNPGVRPEKLVSAHIEHGNEGIQGHPHFLKIAQDSAVLDLVEQLIGPDIILWGCQVFCKPGGDGMAVPWHQDGQYWPIRPLATCTVWIAIDPSKIENGCLRVIPASHQGQRLYQHIQSDREGIVLDQEVDPQQFDARQARDVELDDGQMSLHHVHLIHGSNANRSNKRRAGLALRYMPATSHFDREIYKPGKSSTRTYQVDFSTRPLWLMRGVDRSGKNDFSMGHHQ